MSLIVRTLRSAAPIVSGLLLTLLFVAAPRAAAQEITPIGDVSIVSAVIPHGGFVLIDTTTDGHVITLRNHPASGMLILGLYDGELGMLWEQDMMSDPDSLYTPLIATQRNDSIVVVSAYATRDDSVRFEQRVFDLKSGAMTAVRTLFEIGRDKKTKRTPYHIAAAPDRRSFALYAIGALELGDSAHALNLYTIVYDLDHPTVMRNTFTVAPFEAIEDDDLEHLAVWQSLHTSGLLFVYRRWGWIEHDFDDKVLRSPYDSVDQRVSYDGDYLYTVGFYHDTMLQATRFDPRSGAVATVPCRLVTGTEFDDSHDPDEIGVFPIGGDSVRLFALFRDGNDVPFLPTSWFVDFASQRPVAATHGLMTDDEFEDYYVIHPFFHGRDSTILFMQRIYTEMIGPRGDREWITVYDKVRILQTVGEKAYWLKNAYDDELGSPPTNVSSTSPISSSRTVDLLLRVGDTTVAIRLDLATMNIVSHKPLFLAEYRHNFRHFLHRGPNDFIIYSNPNHEAVLMRVRYRSE